MGHELLLQEHDDAHEEGQEIERIDVPAQQGYGEFLESKKGVRRGKVGDPEGQECRPAKIDAGIFAGTSISFELDRPECSSCGCDIRDCAHIPGEEVDGELCHVILKEVTDVFEGSIVPLGSQGTEFVEARGSDGEPVLPLKDAIKQARGISGETTTSFVMSDGDAAFRTNITQDNHGNLLRISNPLPVDAVDGDDDLFVGKPSIPGVTSDPEAYAAVVDPETHPGDETDDEIRVAIQEDLERVRKIPSTFYTEPSN